MTWLEVIERGLRHCKVYEDAVPKMASAILKAIREEGLAFYPISKALYRCGVHEDDIGWMAEEVRKTCLEEYAKGSIR